MASKDAILNVSDVTLMISQKYKVLDYNCAAGSFRA